MSLIWLAWSYLTRGVIMQSGLERGFRYFKVSPIKAFRDIRHVFVYKVFTTGRISDATGGNNDQMSWTGYELLGFPGRV